MSIVVLWQGRRSKSQNPMENLVSVALYISNPLPILTIHPVLNLKQRKHLFSLSQSTFKKPHKLCRQKS